MLTRDAIVGIGLVVLPLLSGCAQDGGADAPAESASGSSGSSSASDGAAGGTVGEDGGQPPDHHDGIKDLDETDVDCGGAAGDASGQAKRCEDGRTCLDPSDCSSGVCAPGSKTCSAPTASDRVKNGSETGVDCGGPDGIARCPDLEGCAASSDCASKSCDTVAHTCTPARHDDTIKNLDETDVDCGGQLSDASGKATRCADGLTCIDGSDCTSRVCAGGAKTCSPPSPTDRVKNGNETGIDCGGPDNIKRCPDLEGCLAGSDCVSKVCDANTKQCSPPTGTDGQKNGDESDVDCGGTTTGARRCNSGETCNLHADCASAGCGYDGKCAIGRSCTQHHGGDTCGPASTQESCCIALDVPKPTGTFKLDKYVITAGRFRQFVERTNGDIRGFIQNNRPAWWEPVWDAYVPGQMDDGSYISHDGVYQELGPGLFFTPGAGNQGCAVESYGARTYFLPAARSQQLWGEEQHYIQDDLDDKALQCATFFMFAAFCAWDGGRLPTLAELDYAYTGGAANPDATHTYPWGTSPVPAGWNDSWNDLAEAQANGTVKPLGGDQTMAAFSFNWWSPPTRVCGNTWCDYSVHVAPPGRFPKGNGPFGHADLGGLLFNLTSEMSGTPGSSPDGRTVVWGRNGSWEGHAIPFYKFTDTPRAFNSRSKYRSTGARCAR